MEPEFQITPGNPQTTGNFDPEDTTLDEAIETAFALTAEDAVMAWRGILIPLNYKYEVSELVGDAISILKAVVANEEGTYRNCWYCNSFLCVWTILWLRDELRVHSDWTDVRHSVDGEPLLPRLRANPEIHVSRTLFVREWMGLLRKVEECLSACAASPSVLKPLTDILAADPDNQG